MARNALKFTSDKKSHEKLLQKAVENALTAGILVAEDNAVQLAPRAERFGGTLAQSIGHEVNVKEEKAILGATVDYAPYQELGTYKMDAQPFIRPGLNDKNVRKAMTKELERVMG